MVKSLSAQDQHAVQLMPEDNTSVIAPARTELHMNRSGTKLRTPRRRGVLLGAAAAATWALLAPGMPVVEVSDASWQRVQVTGGTFTTVSIPAVRLTAACRYVSVLGLGGRVEIYWVPPTGYDLSKAQVWASTSGLGSVLAPLTGYNLSQNTRFDSAAGHYVTTVPTNLLGGLLGLGTELEVSIVINEHGWTSKPASTATNAGFIAGLGGTCRNIT